MTSTTPTDDRAPLRPLAALVLAGLAAACSGSGDTAAQIGDRSGPKGAGTQAARRAVDVRVRTVRPSSFVHRIDVTGTVEAERTVELKAEESGRIREVLAEKGTRVEEGEAVVRLDARELRAQVREARAQARLAEEQWKRREKLHQEGAISELDFLEVKYRAEQAAARLARLEARLEDTTIEAPFTGVLDDRSVEVGTMVSPGTEVATLVDLRPVKVSAGVPERYADDVRVGDSATVTLPSLEDDVYRGVLSYVGAAVNPDSRTLPVEVRLPNPEGRVKPEMAAELSLVRRRWSDAVVVPQDAVLRTGEGFAVYVVRSGGSGPVARRRPVQLGPREGGDVLVESGLSPGDRLVTTGQQQVADGDRVRIVGEGEAAADTTDAGGRHGDAAPPGSARAADTAAAGASGAGDGG